ncbi:phosphatidylinositol-3,4,5-trisphosphate 3-phosphatase [Tritrichomonas foetus]|uniref:Phosphatidylinositol-3,4,5-trisphosphate 3-phosphatase n=1 Tax=Tritrichomonas foetus TaxID=1144522 RepID=A0A1J4JBR9_9EUKA|nr:phosphatidylinositol-3,4,5-trisphosphate 3-phosphatase [Tritrichomonas foetus]|eukprot:OHS96630.1 phosphatidylinositol-3,4,5-trisphosphate 3-phosphatase [Tritrichomonas foetus]
MTDWIRHIVSGNNNRFIQEGLDLDLTYITDRIIAMGYPSTGIDSLYRNPAKDVADLLDKKHLSHYKIYNLTEKPYDPSLFSGPVENYPFPDHHAPPFNLLLQILKSMHDWYHQDSSNVLVVHCLAGHGRTGTVIASFLLVEKIAETSQAALEYFANERSFNGKGVAYPSQIRSVQYMESYMRKFPEIYFELPPPIPKILRFVKFYNVLKKNNAKYVMMIYDSIFDIVFNSAWIKEPTNIKSVSFGFLTNVPLDSHFTIKLFVMESKLKLKEILRVSLNTFFILDYFIRFRKDDLDGPHRDAKNETFRPDLAMDLIFDE